jgi:hypothetical protein
MRKALGSRSYRPEWALLDLLHPHRRIDYFLIRQSDDDDIGQPTDTQFILNYLDPRTGKQENKVYTRFYIKLGRNYYVALPRLQAILQATNGPRLQEFLIKGRYPHLGIPTSRIVNTNN